MVRNDIVVPGWWRAKKGGRKRPLKGFLREQMLRDGNLIVVKKWNDSFARIRERSFIGDKQAHLIKNPHKDIWNQLIKRKIRRLASKYNAERWLIENGLSLPEKWNNKRAKWETQFRYHLIVLLHRGVLRLLSDENGIKLVINSNTFNPDYPLGISDDE